MNEKANDLRATIQDITLRLLDYCKNSDWGGYDPYDALNSKILSYLPFLDFKSFRLGLTQILKRMPINIRPLLLIPKTQNPKAIALFLMALLKLSRLGLLKEEKVIRHMQDRLVALRSPDSSYWSWGYSFPWQTRTLLVPRGAPNLVCTTFVANALLDAYDKTGSSAFVKMAVSAADYLLKELYWTDSDDKACFAYPNPSARVPVHNANFLGAALLCRISVVASEKELLKPALKVARYSAAQQQQNGSWYYGEDPTQRWIDNFHTGYNLCALKTICEYGETKEFDAHIRRGLEFYQTRFFREDGAPRYFDKRTYPIDIHSVAQSMLTLLTLKAGAEDNADLPLLVLKWSVTHMLSNTGFFYYQTYPFYTNKIPYIRWSQAWMLLALATFLEKWPE